MVARRVVRARRRIARLVSRTAEARNRTAIAAPVMNAASVPYSVARTWMGMESPNGCPDGVTSCRSTLDQTVRRRLGRDRHLRRAARLNGDGVRLLHAQRRVARGHPKRDVDGFVEVVGDRDAERALVTAEDHVTARDQADAALDCGELADRLSEQRAATVGLAAPGGRLGAQDALVELRRGGLVGEQ